MQNAKFISLPLEGKVSASSRRMRCSSQSMRQHCMESAINCSMELTQRVVWNQADKHRIKSPTFLKLSACMRDGGRRRTFVRQGRRRGTTQKFAANFHLFLSKRSKKFKAYRRPQMMAILRLSNLWARNNAEIRR